MLDLPALTALQNALPALTAKNLSFAQSLLAQAADKGSLSEKQMFWVKKLSAPQAAAPEAPAVDLSPIFALFANVTGKFASFQFKTAEGLRFRLSRAGEKSSKPGTINVTDTSKDFAARVWFGRIGLDGKFAPSSKVEAGVMAQVTEALVAFAADPAGQAAKFGHETGSCAFCSHTLDNEASVKLGYGPICAAKWNLPHSYAKPVCEAVA